jgi:hypothetical protein
MPRRLAAFVRRARPERVLAAVRMAGTGVVAALDRRAFEQ